MSSHQKRSIDAIDDIYREAIKTPVDEEQSAQEALSEDFLSGDVFSADGGAEGGGYGQVIMQNLASHDPAWLGKEIAIAADRMRVTFKVRGGKPLSSYQLNHGLEQLGVSFGINWQAMTEAESRAASGWQGEIVVAVGQPAEARRRLFFPEAQRTLALDGSFVWIAAGVRLDGASLRAVLTGERLERIEAYGLMVKAVPAGAVLAKVEENPEAAPGTNVLGEIVEPINDPLPDLGENVRHDEATGLYLASQYGYLALEGNTMSVLPAIWIAPDRLSACYVNLTQMETPLLPTAADLLRSLELAGVRANTIRRSLVEKLIERLTQGGVLSARTVKIAEAVPPRHGRDAQVSFKVDMGERAASLREDGTVDLRTRQAVVMVEAGTLVAEKLTASQGVDGADLFGNTLKAREGVERIMLIDETLRAEAQAERILYYSGKAGNVRFAGNRLTVAEVFCLPGDADNRGGDLDRREDILILGSVATGVSVKSQGNIAIAGSVYSGAKVVAAGDISIGEGIVGISTRVVALGNLQTVFVQEAEVIVKGDALIRSYLYNGVLRANGGITVLKMRGRKSGRIVGGLTCASQGIKVSSVGHPGHSGTVVAILPDPIYSGQLLKLEEEARNCRESIAKVARSLPFDNFDPAIIKRALLALPSEKRESVIKLLSVFNRLIKRQQNVEALRKEIGAKIASEQRGAAIEIEQEIFAGCEVRFGEKKLPINQDMGPTTFSLQGGEIV